MKKAKFLTIITLMIFSIIVMSGGSIEAAISQLGKNSPTNRYTSSGYNGVIDHSFYNYYIDGQQAWCIEAGIAFKNGRDYQPSGSIGIPALSYIMLSGRDDQLKQAAVWYLIGPQGGGNQTASYVINPDQELIDFVNEAKAATANQDVASATISPANGNLSYDSGSNTYRFDFTASAMPSTTAGSVQDNGGGNYTLIVDAASIGGDMDVTLSLPGGGSRTVYDAATIWRSPGVQTVITPNSHVATGAGASATFHIEAVGSMKAGKKDNHGQPVAGTVFEVSGPSGTFTSTTDGNGNIELTGLKVGTYTIREVSVPANLMLNPTVYSGYVGSGSTMSWSFDQVNTYQRGGLKLLKYDKLRRYLNLDKTLGDAKISGAKYELYAAENISEGPTLIYSANQLVRGDLVTDDDGYTIEVDDLPIGKYYFKEVEASEGFDVNEELAYETVDYKGMNEPTATHKTIEHGEKPQVYNLEINKRIQETDYDEEANLSLHDTYHGFEGVKFKITLNSDPSQVYYTHGTQVTDHPEDRPEVCSSLSTDDGLCLAHNIPYGVYTVEEVEWPINVTYPVDSWTIDFRDGSPDVDTDRVSRYYDGKRKVNNSKKVTVEVNKKLVLAPGEDSDAEIQGAIFGLFRDTNVDNGGECAGCSTCQSNYEKMSHYVDYLPENDKDPLNYTLDQIKGYIGYQECPNCDNFVDFIGPTNREGYAKLGGYVWAGTYYLKEIAFPKGIDPDSKVLNKDSATFLDYDETTMPDRNYWYATGGNYEDVTYRNKIYTLECGPEKQTEERKTYSYDILNVPKRNDIQIKKMLEGSANTDRREFENCIFTATLISSMGTEHEFTRVCNDPTDIAGWTMIEDLPFGEYVIKETYCPPISLPCSDFNINILLDRKEKTNPSWYEPTEGVFADQTQVIDTPTGAIVDPIKKMVIKVRKVDEDYHKEEQTDYTSGDGTLKGAIYSIYGLDYQTNEFTSFVEDIVVDKQDEEGYWYAESGELTVGSYMVIEKAKVNDVVSYSDGYLVDKTKHYYYSDPNKQTKEVVKITDLSVETPIKNDIEIIKEIESTKSSGIEKLEGAEFTATLLSTDHTNYEYSKSATTNKDGYCKIEDLPYGTYIVRETVVPEGATACEDFTIVIDQDKTLRGAYTPKDSKEAKSGDLRLDPENGAIIDTPKVMDIKIRKVDSEWDDSKNPDSPRGDAKLKGAVYSIYRWSQTTTDYTTYVDDMIVDKKDDEDYWYAEYDGLKIGRYKVVEKAKNDDKEAYSEGYKVDETPHYFEVVDGPDTPLHTPATENTELVKISRETVVENNIEIIKKIQEASNTTRTGLSGAQFTATLVSSLDEDGDVNAETKQYVSTITDDAGHCIIQDLPYGTYEVEETLVPDTTFKCSNFTIKIEKDKQNHPAYTPEAGSFDGTNQIIDETDGAIVDISKKMVIKLKKVDAENNGKSPDWTQGDASLQGAIYEVYRFDDYTQQYSIKEEDIEVKEKDKDGYWYAETKQLALGKYKIVEKAKEGEYSYAEGYLVDHEEYYFEQNPADQNDEVSYHEATSKETVGRNDIKIIKRIGETTNTTKTGLAGAQFTATLVSSKGTENEFKVNCTALTDDKGFCIIENLPYGVYEVEETIVPDSSFKCSNFTINVEEDKSSKKTPYVPTDGSFSDADQRIDEEGAIVDTPKIMDIKLKKVDYERTNDKAPDWTQGDASLEGAIYTIYRLNPETNEYTTYVDELVIDKKDAEGYWYGEITGLATGSYMAIEKAKENGIYSYATGYKVDTEPHYFIQNPGEQHEERVKLENTSNEKVIRNNIEIIKKIDATTNTEINTLSNCEFTATLLSTKGTDHEFSVKCEAETDENGYCIIKNLPYGEYEVEETKVSSMALKCSNFTVFVSDDMEIRNEAYGPKDGVFKLTSQKIDTDGAIIDTPKVMNLKLRKVDADRTNEASNWTQGDAVLKGAIYDVYEYEPQTDSYTKLIGNIEIDKQDSEGYWYGQFDGVLIGKYMMKERVSRVDEKGVKYSYAEGYLVDEEEHYFESDPEVQTERLVTVTNTSKELVIRGYVEVIKMLDEEFTTDESKAEGAILRLTLDSDPSIYYDVTIDNTGYGKFMDVNDDKHSTSVKTNYGQKYGTSTIPYGNYTITEVRASNQGLHTSYYIYPEKVDIKVQDEIEKRIELDDGVPVTPKLHKYDAETGVTIPLSGAKFKLWDKKNNRFVTQRVPNSGEFTDLFTTNKEGYLYLPQQIDAGYYIVYEVDTPQGYYLEDKYRLPEDQYLGNSEIAGLEVAITKRATGLDEDAVQSQNRVYYDIGVGDRPLMSKVKIYKTGEVFTEVKSETETVNGETHEVKVPQFESKGLKGAEFTIYAATDITTPEGTVRYHEGQEVDRITTDDTGYATSKELYLGEYRIVETFTPLGYVTDGNIGNVILTNDNNIERVSLVEKSLDNKRQKTDLIFRKTFEELKYLIGNEEEKYAVFGVYANEDLENYNGVATIEKDDLVDIIYAKEGENVNTLDLPDGAYYYKEIYSSYPYDIESGNYNFEIHHNTSGDETLKIYGEDVENVYTYGDLYLAKFSTSDFITKNDTTLWSEDTGLDKASEEIQEYMKELNNLIGVESIEAIKEKVMSDGKSMLSGAKYSIFIDEKCEIPLKHKNENGEIVDVEIVTDGSGFYRLEGIPVGTYYFKETEAPTYEYKGATYHYELSPEPVKIDVNPLNASATVIKALYDESVKFEIEKLDIFTGKLVPDCLFTITDETGVELIKFITDKEGKAYIPTDIFENGEYYYFTELEAKNPFYYDENGKLYELNTEPHRFQAHVNEEGAWQMTYVDENGEILAYDKPVVHNYRPTSTVTLTKLDIIDSTPVPNCKFELRSKETDWVVEGVTDENGVYVFENVPFGDYTYTELEAPEEYLIDTTPHEIRIDTEDTKIVVKDLRAPVPELPFDVDTSDIAVASLIVVSATSIFGIFFIIRKRKVSDK